MNDIIKANVEDSNTWMVDISGNKVEHVKEKLINSGIDEDGINTIVNHSARVLGYCPNPQSIQDKSVTGLMIGKVQSGKTSSFITLTALAFDNGYNIAVVFGGTKNNLLNQNKVRLEEYFDNSPDVIVLSGSDEGDELTENKLKNFIELGKKIIIISLKNAQRINALREGLFTSQYIKEQPILLIDDEGDEYSLNTLYKKNRESAVYKSIKNLLNVLKRRAFISVTATPQANMIIPVVNIMSPDFGVLIPPGNGYCGLDTFHDVNSSYCIEIPSDEMSILDNDGIPESFYKALSMFFVASAIYHERESKNKKFSMLIHPSRRVDDLSSVLDKTEEIVNSWRNLISNMDDLEFDSLKRIIDSAINQYKNDGVFVGNNDDLLNSVLYQIRDCGIHLITGQNHLNDKDKNYTNNIYIGGDMVGRGLTIKGLAITYIIRTAKGKSNVDTVQQRARWFGYKNDMLDLCRIFASEKILQEFEDIKNHEEDLWLTIAQNNMNGTKFKDMARLFVLSDKLRMTRTSVGETTSFSFNSWTCEDKFVENEAYNKINLDVIHKLIKDYENQIGTDDYGKDRHNRSLRNVDFETIVKKYLKNFYFPEDNSYNYDFICKIKDYLCMSNEKPLCDIVWPRCENINGKWVQKDSNHEIIDGYLKNYMVGQSPKCVSKEKADYAGDRYIHTGNVIEIQFHNIHDTITGKNSIAMALYIPPNYMGRMTNIVTTSY